MARESAAQRAKNAQLAAQIMEMSASGQTLPKIASALNLSVTWVTKLHNREIERVLKANEDVRERVFAQELENTRLLRAAIMPLALRGNPRAVEVALAVGREFRSQLRMTEALHVEVNALKVEETLDKLVLLIDGEGVATEEPMRRYREIPSEQARLAADGEQ